MVLAIYVGYHVVWNVTPALHTPLMAWMSRRDEGPRGPQGTAPDVEGEENAVGRLLLHRIDVTRDHGQALTQPHDLDAVLLGHVCADEVVRDHTGQ